MAFNLLVNGLAGSIPIFGDAFSFMFRCHAKNVAALLREVKQGEEGACPRLPTPVCSSDILIPLVLMVLIISLIAFVGLWLWQHDLSVISFLFPPPYSSRSVR
jgi:hypothetical protein